MVSEFRPADRPEWLHEIKHDGYRLIIQRDGKSVRLWTKGSHDWSHRYPLITEAALRNRHTPFVIDGVAVLLGVDGRSDFNWRIRAGPITRCSSTCSTAWSVTATICAS